MGGSLAEGSLFARVDRFDLGIVATVAVGRVESCHAQQARKAAEMRVGNEARPAQWPLAHPQQFANVERLERRIDGNSIAIANLALETD